ncbi:MAG: L-serine ammonia-lyase, iron-sulfur-dependent, subunit alpha [Eubacteriaceae bacterium]|jgi:L-cysteine desulfidase|nr:L-serine ammonia-lyase, iron-sulfur-dependent, subunit alpha [Eubacteriaceae bacterium]
MKKGDLKYDAFVSILNEELVPAMGCTEPISLAFVAAKAREVLGCLPDSVEVGGSGSIIKNVKSVIVPHTGGMKGMEAAAAIGIVAGKSDRELEVIADVSEEQIKEMRDFLDTVPIKVYHQNSGLVFDIVVKVSKGDSYAVVRAANNHTNIVHIERDGEVLLDRDPMAEGSEQQTDRSLLSMKDIWEFINDVDLDDIRTVLETQIKYNTAIAQEGMDGNWGANIGKTLIKTYGNDVRTRAKAYAAAGSDARMSGCELPVVINSGSGNQGITVTMPVVVYAEELHKTEEEKLRALALANLVSVHIKTPIGVLSAYCGAVSAGAGAGAGVAYLLDKDYEEVCSAVNNAISAISGIVCDGAKASCAMKIVNGIEAGIFGADMHKNGQDFVSGDGIVGTDIEQTIANVGKLGKEGMEGTNEEIIEIMVGGK